MNVPISAIEQLIPHRSPFLFVDDIVVRTSTTIICQKKVCIDDHYLVFNDGSDHYVSEVALIECLLQSGACLLAECSSVSTIDEKKQKYFIGSPVVKFGAVPKIGDTLSMHVEIVQKFGNNSRLQGKIFCESTLVLEGVFLVAEK
jgi:3-hydroxyacyl-[acyl-carrier-protein] dehydratase